MAKSDDIKRRDLQLIKEVQKGDLDAYGVLVRHHQGMLIGYAVNRLGDESTAKEVVQLTFIRAYEQLDEFREEGNFGVWLSVICKSFILTELTRRRREYRNLDNYTATFELSRIDRLEVAAEAQPGIHENQQALLRECVKGLQAQAASVIQLRYAEGLKCREIAARKNRSLTWVTSTLSRARQALKKCVDTQLEEAAG